MAQVKKRSSLAFSPFMEEEQRGCAVAIHNEGQKC